MFTTDKIGSKKKLAILISAGALIVSGIIGGVDVGTASAKTKPYYGCVSHPDGYKIWSKNKQGKKILVTKTCSYNAKVAAEKYYGETSKNFSSTKGEDGITPRQWADMCRKNQNPPGC